MSTSSEERRRTEAALVRAIDVNPSVEAPETHDAVCAYVDLLAEEGLLPEAVLIAFKTTIARAESLQRLESDARESARSALVSVCIDRYFSPRVADDLPSAKTSPLRLVRDDRESHRRVESPDAPV